MGKYSSVIAGSAVSLLGLFGIIVWWEDFLMVLRGSVPAILIFGGVIALIAGWSEIKDELAASKAKENK